MKEEKQTAVQQRADLLRPPSLRKEEFVEPRLLRVGECTKLSVCCRETSGLLAGAHLLIQKHLMKFPLHAYVCDHCTFLRYMCVFFYRQRMAWSDSVKVERVAWMWREREKGSRGGVSDGPLSSYTGMSGDCWENDCVIKWLTGTVINVCFFNAFSIHISL